AGTGIQAPPTARAQGRAGQPSLEPAPTLTARPNATGPPQFEAIRAGCHASPSRCVLLVRDVGRDNPHPPCTGGRSLFRQRRRSCGIEASAPPARSAPVLA